MKLMILGAVGSQHVCSEFVARSKREKPEFLSTNQGRGGISRGPDGI